MKKIFFISMVVVVLVFAAVYAAETSKVSKVKAAKEKTAFTARQKCMDNCLVTFNACRKPCKSGKAGTECKKKCAADKESCIKKCPAPARRN